MVAEDGEITLLEMQVSEHSINQHQDRNLRGGSARAGGWLLSFGLTGGSSSEC